MDYTPTPLPTGRVVTERGNHPLAEEKLVETESVNRTAFISAHGRLIMLAFVFFSATAMFIIVAILPSRRVAYYRDSSHEVGERA